MDLMKWDPSRTLLGLKEDVNSLFDRFFEGRTLPSFIERGWNPAVDVVETEKGFEVTAELPGLSPDDIDVSVTGDTLTIKGEKKQETVEEGRNYHRVERSYGAFSRTIRLHTAVKSDEVKAGFKDGILSIKLPKVEAELKKTIKVGEED